MHDFEAQRKSCLSFNMYAGNIHQYIGKMNIGNRTIYVHFYIYSKVNIMLKEYMSMESNFIEIP